MGWAVEIEEGESIGGAVMMCCVCCVWLYFILLLCDFDFCNSRFIDIWFALGCLCMDRFILPLFQVVLGVE